MRIRTGLIWTAIVVAVTAGNAQAQVDGVTVRARVFNDYSTSDLVIVNNDSVNDGPGVSQVTSAPSGR